MKNPFRLLLIVSLYAVINLPYLTTFPPVNNTGDESWKMNVAVELMGSGKPVASMFVDTPVGEGVQLTTTWIYNGLLSMFFYLFGISIWSGRFLSFVCGLFVVLTTYRFGKAVGGSRTGLLAALLISTFHVFSWHSREMRQEVMLMAFVTFSIYLFYIAWETKKDRFLFLSGLISTISVQVHPNGSIFALSIFIVYLIIYKNIFSKSAILFFPGLFTGFIVWIFFNYLPYSVSSFQTVHKDYLPLILTHDFLTLVETVLYGTWYTFTPEYLRWQAFKYHSYFLVSITYFTFLLILIAFIFGKNRKNICFPLCFIVLPLLIKDFLTGSWNWFHFSVFIPLYSIVLAASIYNISDMFSRERFKRMFAPVVAIIIITLGVWDIMGNNIEMTKYDYGTFMERVSVNIPEGSTVLGATLYYPAFVKRDVRFVGYLFLKERCPDFADKIRKLDIDYILMDDTFEGVVIFWCSSSYYKDQLIRFLNLNASLEKVIEANYPSRMGVMESVYLFKVNK